MILIANGAHIGELAVSGDGHHGTRQCTGINLCLVPGINLRQPPGREVNIGRIGHPHRVLSEGHSGQTEH
jgi:hypothetical protein